MKVKKILIIFTWVAGLFLLTGCPEEAGNELDLSMFVKNNLSDSLYLRIYGKTSLPEKDSLLTDQDVDIIYNFLDDTFLIVGMDSLETREFENTFSSETIMESPIGEHHYLVNIDTLRNYTPESWDRRAGMKYYYLFSLNDYEQINYTFEFP
jgi:hypothetical protein